MAINNGIGRVWAANAGEEGRPVGVGSVWIENIDAITPSGGGGHTYTGGNGIDVDNVNDTISLDSETEAAINSYVTNSGSFLTSDDLNGYATETWVENKNYITSADIPPIPSYTAGDGIEIDANEVSVKIGTGLTFEDSLGSKNLQAPVSYNTSTHSYSLQLLGRLDSATVAALRSGPVTLRSLYAFSLMDYGSGVHFAICKNTSNNYPDPYQGFLIAFDTVYSAPQQYDTYTMSVGDSYTVDFSSLNSSSTGTWSDVEADPTSYYLQLISWAPNDPSFSEFAHGPVVTPTELWNDVVTVEIVDPSAPKNIAVDNTIFNGYATETWVQNQGYISSIPSEYVTDTEMSTYVTEQTADFITSADIPDVPEVKDLVAGNGIDITTTSADVTIAAKVDGSTITFNQNGELQASGGSSYTAGNGIAINGSELSVSAGAGLKFSSGTSIDRKGATSETDPWYGQFAGIRVSPWMLVTEGNAQKIRFYCAEHEMSDYIGYSAEGSSLSTSAKVAIFKYDDDQGAYVLEAESQLTAGKLVPRYSVATDAYAYILGTAQGDPDGGIYLVEFTLNAAVDVTDGYQHYAFFLTDADTGTAQLSGEGINGLYGMSVPVSVASSVGDALITPGEMSVDTTSVYDTSSPKPATCAAIASAIAQAPSGGAEYTEDDGEMTLSESCDSNGIVITSQGPLYISKSGGLMGYGKITTNCLIKENGSLVDKVKVTFNNGLAEAVGTVIDRGTSPSNSYMIIAVPVFGVYNFTSSLNEIFMRITLTGAESGHTYTYDDSGYSEQVRKVEMYWI